MDEILVPGKMASFLRRYLIVHSRHSFESVRYESLPLPSLDTYINHATRHDNTSKIAFCNLLWPVHILSLEMIQYLRLPLSLAVGDKEGSCAVIESCFAGSWTLIKRGLLHHGWVRLHADWYMHPRMYVSSSCGMRRGIVICFFCTASRSGPGTWRRMRRVR